MKLVLEVDEIYTALREALQAKTDFTLDENKCGLEVEDENGKQIDVGDITFTATV